MKPAVVDQLKQDVAFAVMRSSGPGGQHVNKTNTKVVVILDLHACSALTAEEKERVRQKLARRITRDGKLMVASQQYKSQLQNKEDSFLRLVEVLTAALFVQKKRKKTSVPVGVKRKRLSDKRQRAEKKSWRRSPE